MIIKRITAPSKQKQRQRLGVVEVERRQGDPVTVLVQPADDSKARAKQGRRAWRLLWQKHDADPAWFETWKKNIPWGCDCRRSANSILAKHPPRFDSSEAWFAWKWEFHNLVNAKLQKPTVSIERARMLWLHQRPPTNRTRCIVTVAHGVETVELLKVTHPLIAAYAESCDADLIDIDNDTEDWWGLEKFRTWHFAQQYEECLFLDADTIIRPGCPSLFGRHSLVAMHNDHPWLDRHDWLTKERAEVSARLGQPIADLPLCLNSGVVYTQREAADTWRPPTGDIGRTHCAEQIVVESQAMAFEPEYLDSRFNWQWYFKGFRDGIDDAWIIHLANCPNKIAEAQRIIAGLD